MTEKKALRKNLKRGGAAVLILVLLLSLVGPGRLIYQKALWASGFGTKSDAPLNIHVIDVGKADAILIECEGHTALLDAGTAAHGDDVVDHMARNGLNELEYAIVSHPDKDHFGGMAQVLSEVPCKTFVRSACFEESYSEINEVLTARSVATQVVAPGDVIPLGSAVLRVLGPLEEYEDSNDASLVLKLEYPGFSALFCGDMEETAEKDLIRSGIDLSADLIKVAHHGSKSSSSKRFLKAVQPKIAVVSVGKDNNKLPTEKVMARLDEFCEEVYRTDVDGSILFSFDETGLHVKTGI